MSSNDLCHTPSIPVFVVYNADHEEYSIIKIYLDYERALNYLKEIEYPKQVKREGEISENDSEIIWTGKDKFVRKDNGFSFEWWGIEEHQLILSKEVYEAMINSFGLKPALETIAKSFPANHEPSSI